MSTLTPTGPHEEPTGDHPSEAAAPENPLLAFGSEGGDQAAEWPPIGGKTGQQRLSEMSWSADEAARPGSGTLPGEKASVRERAIIAALVLGCVIVGFYLFAEPAYTPLILPDVQHPPRRTMVGLIQPVPVPPPAELSTTYARPLPASALATSTAGRAPISRTAASPQSTTVASGTSRPGAVAGLGSLSINAQPWADVWIDGQSAGQTPIANLQVTLGTHEVLFRHPQLGERRETVQVTSLAPTRISMDLRN